MKKLIITKIIMLICLAFVIYSLSSCSTCHKHNEKKCYVRRVNGAFP